MSSNEPTPYERFEQAAEIPMLGLSLVFLATLIAPEVATLSDSARRTVELVGYLIWGAFAAEVVILAVLAPSLKRMLRDHWLDVLIVAAPFLRPLRLARLLRVVRTGSALGRLLTAVSRVTSRRGFQAYGAVTLVVIAISGVLVWAVERSESDANITSAGDGLWWAIVTASTVGYGDHFPVSPAGRGVAVLLILIGIGMLGVVTANIAALFVTEDTNQQIAEIRSQLDRIESLLRSSTG